MNDRLKEIKESIKDEISPVLVGDDVTWLIEQAEEFKQRKDDRGDNLNHMVEVLGNQLDAANERIAELEANYQELIMGVASKYPNETRHETAKRYICEREEHKDNETKEQSNEH